MSARRLPATRTLWPALALWTISLGAVAQAQPAIDVSAREPRAYGHVVGDRIQRALRLQLPAGYRFERASLPKEGEQAYWLDLVAVDMDADSDRGGTVTVVLDYQLFYAPLQASRRELPALNLSAADAAGARITARVPAFVFTMSPILELNPDAGFGDSDNDLLLGDERPRLRAVSLPRRAALIALAVGLLAIVCWAWAARRLPGRARGPFAVALVRLRRLRRTRPTTDSVLRTVHRAFDETAGRAVFADDLDMFIAAHPTFADMADDIAGFFEFSRRYFFAASAPADCDRQVLIARLERLARRCRKRELKA